MMYLSGSSKKICKGEGEYNSCIANGCCQNQAHPGGYSQRDATSWVLFMNGAANMRAEASVGSSMFKREVI